jgi:hypothetical protein
MVDGVEGRKRFSRSRPRLRVNKTRGCVGVT